MTHDNLGAMSEGLNEKERDSLSSGQKTKMLIEEIGESSASFENVFFNTFHNSGLILRIQVLPKSSKNHAGQKQDQATRDAAIKRLKKGSMFGFLGACF